MSNDVLRMAEVRVEAVDPSATATAKAGVPRSAAAPRATNRKAPAKKVQGRKVGRSPVPQ